MQSIIWVFDNKSNCNKAGHAFCYQHQFLYSIEKYKRVETDEKKANWVYLAMKMDTFSVF